MDKNYSFDTNKESLKNQKLSDYEMMDFVSNHIDSTQKDSMIDRITIVLNIQNFKLTN